MNISFEDQIRERAYHIWLAGGMAEGQAHEHWLSAEQAVKSEPVVIITKAKPAKTPTATRAAAKPVAAKAKPAAAKVVKKPAAKAKAKVVSASH